MPITSVTRINAIVERIKPLADWMRTNKPGTRHIHIYKNDWLYLLKAPPEAIRAAGFNVTKENGLTYGSFTLRPVDQKVEKA